MKKTVEHECPFCGKYIYEDENDVFTAKSKRNTITYFHGKCFDMNRKRGSLCQRNNKNNTTI